MVLQKKKQSSGSSDDIYVATAMIVTMVMIAVIRSSIT
jgi:hypothetical protein